MRLIDIIHIYFPDFNPVESKVHLAVWNGKDEPLDVFLAGNFQSWQEIQTRKNFERKYILSLISLPYTDKWIFGGIYESKGCKYDSEKKEYEYKTIPVKEVNELVGRLVIKYSRTSRQSYLYFEKLLNSCLIHEFKPERLSVEEFPGYNKTCISKSTLDIIIRNQLESWKSALSNIAGIYLITDKLNGKLYVGSATGDRGIWQRWTDYSNNGHGGNKDLIEIIKKNGKEYCNNFQYSILEIADTHASENDIKKRESYWKNVFCSIEHGYNANY